MADPIDVVEDPGVVDPVDITNVTGVVVDDTVDVVDTSGAEVAADEVVVEPKEKEKEKEEPNYLNMSDEELERLGEPEGLDVEDTPDTNTDANSTDVAKDVVVDDVVKDATTTKKAAASDEDGGDDNKNEDNKLPDGIEDIFKPFKANGSDIQVESSADVIKLMQMGANYASKMEGIKEVKQYAAMLKQADLLDPDRLNFLIDVHKGDPLAIAKLLKDTDIDPLRVDPDDGDEYKNNDANKVSTDEIALNEVLSTLEQTETYQTMLGAVDSMDTQSKDFLAANPDNLTTFNEHIQSGVYERINAVVVREKALGRLNVPYLQAYKSVGDSMQEAGAFDPDNNAGTKHATGNPNILDNNTNATKQNTKTDVALNDKRKAAGITRTKPASTATSIDYLNMSDEEFEKLNYDIH